MFFLFQEITNNQLPLKVQDNKSASVNHIKSPKKKPTQKAVGEHLNKNAKFPTQICP